MKRVLILFVLVLFGSPGLAQFNLAILYRTGRSVRKHPRQMRIRLRRAKANGSVIPNSASQV